MKLLIATNNPHKLDEIRAMLAAPGLEFLSCADFPDIPEVEEDGETLEENAIKKAVSLATATDLWALADDTGLEVAALDGAPGVFSARYAGEPSNADANIARLLRELDGINDRRAVFRTVIALADPAGRARTVEGACPGVITGRRAGEHGFGYDPVFLPDGAQETFAELSSDAKNRISHRARALEKARTAWADLLATEIAE